MEDISSVCLSLYIKMFFNKSKGITLRGKYFLFYGHTTPNYLNILLHCYSTSSTTEEEINPQLEKALKYRLDVQVIYLNAF